MKVLVFLVAVVGPLMLHWAIVRESDALIRAFFLLVAGGLVLVAFERRQWFRPLAGAAALVVVAWVIDTALLRAVTPVWAAFVYVGLAWMFGRTLRAGSMPLIERFARIEHGDQFPLELVPYARRLTRIWSGFFVGLAIVTLALAVVATTEVLSFFTNILSWVLIVLLYGLEFVYRRAAYPHVRHANPLRVAVSIARHAPSFMR